MKTTQLRVKNKTTALTTMEIETWIEKKHGLKRRNSLYPLSEKCYDIPSKQATRGTFYHVVRLA